MGEVSGDKIKSHNFEMGGGRAGGRAAAAARKELTLSEPRPICFFRPWARAVCVYEIVYAYVYCMCLFLYVFFYV